ncbi:MAG: hypothetical protein ACKOHG_11065 [Planctomycetia bacterium]
MKPQGAELNGRHMEVGFEGPDGHAGTLIAAGLPTVDVEVVRLGVAQVAVRDLAHAQPQTGVGLGCGDVHALRADGHGLHRTLKRSRLVAGWLSFEDGCGSAAVEVLAEEPVVLGDGLFRAPAAAVVVAAGDRDAGLSRGPVVLEFGDRSRLRPWHGEPLEKRESGSTGFDYRITGRFPKALPTIGR